MAASANVRESPPNDDVPADRLHHIRALGGLTADLGTRNPFWMAGRAVMAASDRFVAATGGSEAYFVIGWRM
jgi:hypothetical protein